MGENFKRKQTEQFKHGRDQALEHFRQETLLTLAPDLMGRAFTCQCTSEEAPSIGEEIVLISTPAGVNAMCGNTLVGTLSPADAADIARTMNSAPGCAGMLVATLHEHSFLTNEFSVRISFDNALS
ncbi:hypothetical protein [Stigmatella aurantiaca]|uniref:hypothetical protein n=1 Tax=Stigmatella aurantiaca TaxID=41 RepID=UPI00055A14B7|nr:hypothetical protein [Stigmatella aurantiaca]